MENRGVEQNGTLTAEATVDNRHLPFRPGGSAGWVGSASRGPWWALEIEAGGWADESPRAPSGGGFFMRRL